MAEEEGLEPPCLLRRRISSAVLLPIQPFLLWNFRTLMLHLNFFIFPLLFTVHAVRRFRITLLVLIPAEILIYNDITLVTHCCTTTAIESVAHTYILLFLERNPPLLCLYLLQELHKLFLQGHPFCSCDKVLLPITIYLPKSQYQILHFGHLAKHVTPPVILAEGEGFEPTRLLRLRFSKPACLPIPASLQKLAEEVGFEPTRLLRLRFSRPACLPIPALLHDLVGPGGLEPPTRGL